MIHDFPPEGLDLNSELCKEKGEATVPSLKVKHRGFANENKQRWKCLFNLRFQFARELLDILPEHD